MRIQQDGVFPFANEFNAVVSAFAGLSVQSGCGITPQGGNMTLVAASGVVELSGAIVSYAGGTITLSAASAFKRYDLVIINSAGALAKVDGSVAQKAPDLPTGAVLLAIVAVPAGASSIVSGNIYDARVLTQGASLVGDYIATAPNIGTVALGLQIAADSVDVSGASIATVAGSSLGIPTLTATGAKTVTTASTLRIVGAPVAGTNVTITTALALEVVAGNAKFGGNVGIGGPPGTLLDIIGGVFRVRNTDTQAALLTITPVAGTNNVRVTTNYTTGNGNLTFGAGGINDQVILTNGGGFGIGVPPLYPLHASGAGVIDFSAMPTVAGFFSTDSQAADKGAGIELGGVYQTTSQTVFAYIGGLKENSTSGNTAGYFKVATRTAAGTLLEALRIDSLQNAFIIGPLLSMTGAAGGALSGGVASARAVFRATSGGNEAMELQGEANFPTLRLTRANTTYAAPSNLANADVVGQVTFDGRVNAGYLDLAYIRSYYTGSGTTQLANLRFYVSQSGNPTEALRLGDAPTSGQTVAYLQYHNGTALTLQQVTVGATDSGGAGFKLLRVPN